MSEVSVSPGLGTGRLIENILRNVPQFWDTSPGSRFGALLSAIGASDQALGGEQVDAAVVEGTLSAGSVGSATDAGQTWETNQWVGYQLRVVSTNLRYDITANTADTLTLDTEDTLAIGDYEIIIPGSSIQNAKSAFFVKRATGIDLDFLGQSLGVPRIRETLDDDTYRTIIPICAWEPKPARYVVEQLLTALLGPKADVGWDVYTIQHCELLIELPSAALGSGTGTYLLEDATVAGGTDSSPPEAAYLAEDDSEVGPPSDGAVMNFLVGSDTVGNTELAKLLLDRYIKAAGVRVRVVAKNGA